jgi:hypothetical protein
MTAKIIELRTAREMRRQGARIPSWEQLRASGQRLADEHPELMPLPPPWQLPVVSTQAEFAALAPGAFFRGPDGKKRQKPA